MTTTTTNLLHRFRTVRPRNQKELAAYVQAFLGLKIPAKRICADHDSPMDYLAATVLGNAKKAPDDSQGSNRRDALKHTQHSTPVFRLREYNREAFEGKSLLEEIVAKHSHSSVMRSSSAPACNPVGNLPPHNSEILAGTAKPQDFIVWANRGGGKTQLGAVASLLEAVLQPGCEVCILGGSEDQSQRMYDYLRAAVERGYGRFVAGNITQRTCRFANGSSVTSLAQSDRSVRGRHVQRLRCDELELFDRDVWRAAQFIPQSARGIPARLEVMSTLHRPYGLMAEIIADAPKRNRRVFKWCLWEVIEPCRDRVCSRCALWEECRGRAKHADGYLSIDDAIAYKLRSSEKSFQAEMLCREPLRDDVVFGEFDRRRHVADIAYDANLPLYRTFDFGFTNPLVCLLVQFDGGGCVRVLDEHVKCRTTLAEHARLIRRRWPWPVRANYGDPAGAQCNEITGTSVVTELAALGLPITHRSGRILDGLELIRDYLAPADGQTRLIVSPKCQRLIAAFEQLHYARDAHGRLSEFPEKDGVHDHPIDALRYFFINRLGRTFALAEKRY